MGSAMGADSPRSFSAISAAKRATFISYRETADKLAAFTGDSLVEIASGLIAHGIHLSDLACISGVEQAVWGISDSAPLLALLTETIKSGGIKSAWFELDQPDADPDSFGWFREKLEFNLAVAELPNPSSLLTPAPYLSRRAPVPAWIKVYVGRFRISFRDAAQILAGFDPTDTSGFWDDDSRAWVNGWQDTLDDAIEAGSIEASSWGSNRGTEQMLSHADIRAWCSALGHQWPIPVPTAAPATDAELLVRLRQIETERDEALTAREATQAGYEILKRGVDNTKALSASVGELQAQLVDARSEIERLLPRVPPRPDLLMGMAITVQRRYWGDNWDPSEKDSWPKADDILDWLSTEYPETSDAQRRAVEKVACPVNRGR